MNPAQRRRSVCSLLSHEPLTKANLLARLDPPPTLRTLDEDLRWLTKTFPSQVRTGLEGRAKTWHFNGEIPHLLPEPLTHLDDDQVAALIVARGLLRLTDLDKPAAEGTTEDYPGTLAQALDRLLRQSGQAAEADRIAPDAVTISRFGVAPEEHMVFPLCFQAIRAGEALRFTYTNQSGKVAPVHVQPIRLAHIAGE